VNGELLKEKG